MPIPAYRNWSPTRRSDSTSGRSFGNSQYRPATIIDTLADEQRISELVGKLVEKWQEIKEITDITQLVDKLIELMSKPGANYWTWADDYSSKVMAIRKAVFFQPKDGNELAEKFIIDMVKVLLCGNRS